MILFGTVVNALLIILGTFLGRFLHNIPERMKETIMYGIGLAVTVIGVQMTFESTQILIVIISIVVGAVIGEWLDLDNQVTRLGQWLEMKLPRKNDGTNISEGFVTATLIFVVGSMAIIGAIDSGLRNDHNVLVMKGIIDGFTSIILSSSLGIGVAFAAIPVFIYQGLITLLSTQISQYIPQALLDFFIYQGLITLLSTQISQYIPQALLDFFISEMTATGGLMILAIGLNLIGLTKIRVANLVPGIIVVGVIVSIIHFL